MKLYTLGEIYRLKLLKNHEGKPYSSKGALSHVFQMLPYKTKKTPWGDAKCLTQAQIDAFNKKNVC